MSKLTKWVAGAVLVSSAMVTTSSANAEVSYNVGYVSEYYFRGVLQKVSSASAGADFESGGFYIGTWAADVGDGLEVDGYFGYGIETEAGLSASIGFTGYYYTGDTFDDTYQEINLSVGYGPASLEYSFGEHDNLGGYTEDYDFIGLTLESENGFYGTIGAWGFDGPAGGPDVDHEYFEVGYGTTIAEFDVGIAAIFSDGDLSFDVDSTGMQAADEALVFSLGKTF